MTGVSARLATSVAGTGRKTAYVRPASSERRLIRRRTRQALTCRLSARTTRSDCSKRKDTTASCSPARAETSTFQLQRMERLKRDGIECENSRSAPHRLHTPVTGFPLDSGSTQWCVQSLLAECESVLGFGR